MAERQRHRATLEWGRRCTVQFFLIPELKLNSIRSCVCEISYELGSPNGIRPDWIEMIETFRNL
jgi:hypothetical protein